MTDFNRKWDILSCCSCIKPLFFVSCFNVLLKSLSSAAQQFHATYTGTGTKFVVCLCPSSTLNDHISMEKWSNLHSIQTILIRTCPIGFGRIFFFSFFFSFHRMSYRFWQNFFFSFFFSSSASSSSFFSFFTFLFP